MIANVDYVRHRLLRRSEGRGLFGRIAKRASLLAMLGLASACSTSSSPADGPTDAGASDAPPQGAWYPDAAPATWSDDAGWASDSAAASFPPPATLDSGTPASPSGSDAGHADGGADAGFVPGSPEDGGGTWGGYSVGCLVDGTVYTGCDSTPEDYSITFSGGSCAAESSTRSPVECLPGTACTVTLEAGALPAGKCQ